MQRTEASLSSACQLAPMADNATNPNSEHNNAAPALHDPAVPSRWMFMIDCTPPQAPLRSICVASLHTLWPMETGMPPRLWRLPALRRPAQAYPVIERPGREDRRTASPRRCRADSTQLDLGPIRHALGPERKRGPTLVHVWTQLLSVQTLFAIRKQM
jgi:hypothetical protein